MKNKLFSMSLLILLLSSCVIGGVEEADNIEGTWVSSETYLTNSKRCYIYYYFDPTSIDSTDGDHSGKYSIRAYESVAPWGANYTTLEKGKYYTDYIFSTIEFRNSADKSSRYLDYELDEDDFYLTDAHYWSGTKLHLKKI